jgi:hypothetical protein
LILMPTAVRNSQHLWCAILGICVCNSPWHNTYGKGHLSSFFTLACQPTR